MIKLRYFLALTLAFVPRVATADQTKSEILATARNEKYRLVCTFHGFKERVPGALPDGVVNHITYVTLSDLRTNQTIRFAPSGLADLTDPQVFFTDVWSPNHEWLVLPLGQFYGFQVIHAATAMAEIRRRRPEQFIRLQGPQSVGLSHQFAGWSADGSFRIWIDDPDRPSKRWLYLIDVPTLSVSAKDAGLGPVQTFITANGTKAIQ